MLRVTTYGIECEFSVLFLVFNDICSLCVEDMTLYYYYEY